MQNSEELRFFEWAQLQRISPNSPSQSVLNTGINTSPVPLHSFPSLSQPPPPTATPVPGTTERMDRHNDAPQLPPIFNRLKLKNEPPILSAHRLHQENAMEALRSILKDIEDGLIPESSAVDVLIVHHQGQFACPFAGCLKKYGGWNCPRNARDHLWIHHLFRQFPCKWEGWCVSYSTNQFSG
jgi:hypothetical protein